jgi:light-regulated signal transduction histidine kinase (bacteriophytochrome)
MEPVDLKELLHDTLHNVQELIHDNNAEIIVGNLPKIKCDPSQMMRVFQNLISNSIKYRSDADPKIIIEGRESGRWFTITVSDNGIGIDPKYSERIFQIFQRLHTRTKYQGTGIGLAICKRIIERHNGKIWLETDYSGGASISFTIDKHTGNNHEREYITD